MNSLFALIVFTLCLIIISKAGSVKESVPLISNIRQLNNLTSVTFVPFFNNQNKATWGQNRKRILKQENSLRVARDLLNGKILRVTTLQENTTSQIFFFKLSSALGLAGNFTIQNVSVTDNAGIRNESNKSWQGSIGELVNEKADIATYLYTMNSQRLEVVDFTVTVIKSQICLYIKKPEAQVVFKRSGYMKPFTNATWCGIIFIMITTLILLTFMKRKIEKELHYGSFLPEIFLYVWGISCLQGLPEFPKTLSLRILYYAIFFCGFFVSTLYSASFVSDLVVVDNALPFHSMEEFAEDKSYKLIVYRSFTYYENIKNSEDYYWKKLREKLLQENELPINDNKIEEMICAGNVAFIGLDLLKTPVHLKGICHWVKICTKTYNKLSWALQKNSPYKQAINYYLIKLKTSGILNQLESNFGDARISDLNDVRTKFTAVTASDISTLLALFLGSILLSLIVLCLEKIYFRSYEKKICQKTATLLRSLAARIRKRKFRN